MSSTLTTASSTSDISLHFTPSLHPHLIITAHPPPATTTSNATTCALHLALTLPDALFPDPDELADLWQPAGTPAPSPKPGRVHWAVSPSAIDIERPARDGEEEVELLLIVEGTSGGGEVHVDVPLHVRYLPPTEEGRWDVPIFDGADGGRLRRAWVCEQNADTVVVGQGVDVTSGMAVGVLEDVAVSKDLTLRLPAARPEYRVAVEVITAAVVWGGWAFLVCKIARMGWRGKSRGSGRSKKAE